MLLFLSACGLAILFCAPPGAITAQALRRGVVDGFKATFLLEVGSLVGDATWAIIALAGAAFLAQNIPMRLALGIIGIFLLLHLAWGALRDASHGHMPEAGQIDARSDFALGVFVSLTNPLAAAFWLSIGSSAVMISLAHPTPLDFVIFFTGYMLGSILWCFFMASLIAWGRRFITPSLFRIINLVCGLALLYFTGKLLWTTVMILRG